MWRDKNENVHPYRSHARHLTTTEPGADRECDGSGRQPRLPAFVPRKEGSPATASSRDVRHVDLNACNPATLGPPSYAGQCAAQPSNSPACLANCHSRPCLRQASREAMLIITSSDRPSMRLSRQDTEAEPRLLAGVGAFSLTESSPVFAPRLLLHLQPRWQHRSSATWQRH